MVIFSISMKPVLVKCGGETVNDSAVVNLG